MHFGLCTGNVHGVRFRLASEPGDFTEEISYVVEYGVGLVSIVKVVTCTVFVALVRDRVECGNALTSNRVWCKQVFSEFVHGSVELFAEVLSPEISVTESSMPSVRDDLPSRKMYVVVIFRVVIYWLVIFLCHGFSSIHPFVPHRIDGVHHVIEVLPLHVE